MLLIWKEILGMVITLDSKVKVVVIVVIQLVHLIQHVVVEALHHLEQKEPIK